MAWNRITLFEGDAQVDLTLQERTLDHAVGVNGIWWWNDPAKYTALGSSERTDHIWVFAGADIQIGAWQTNLRIDVSRSIGWFLRFSYAGWSANGKLSVLSFVPKGEGKVSFPERNFPGTSGFRDMNAVTWAPVEFASGKLRSDRI